MTKVLTWLQGSTAVHQLSDSKLPKEFILEQNYPNPFNSRTEIRYQLPRSAHVSLKIYNVVGQLVRTLVDGTISEGYHSIQWDGRDNAGTDMASGLYLYRLEVDIFCQERRMVLLR